MLLLKHILQRGGHDDGGPPETNELYGPVTSRVGELHSAAGPRGWLGIPTAAAAAAAAVAAVFVGLSCQLVLLRFSTQFCEEATMCCL